MDRVEIRSTIVCGGQVFFFGWRSPADDQPHLLEIAQLARRRGGPHANLYSERMDGGC